MSLLDRDGVKIHYEVFGEPGDGPPVLLSHGSTSTSTMWEVNLPALSAKRQVITWDARGHGGSSSPGDPAQYTPEHCVADMAAILDKLAIDQAVLGGLSLGGYLTLSFCLAHPERVAALMLFDTGPGYKSESGRAAWNRHADGVASGFEASVADGAPTGEKLGDPHNVDPAGLARAARGILPQRDSGVILALPSIAVPVMVVVGSEDERFLASAEYMAKKIPGARKVILPRAGHFANRDQPAEFNAAVLDFLEGLAGDRPR